MVDSEKFVQELSDELCNSIKKNVRIDGDKNGFNSKMAIEKFKACVKKMDEKNNNLDLEELKKYIKSNYKLEIIKYDTKDKDIIIKISEIQVLPVKNQVDTKKLLKEKIKSLSNHRTNIDLHKAKTDENVSDEILKEYTKLKRISKIPVPEPSEIFSNPEQYKPILSMVLNNKMATQIGNNHPYIRYFRLIAEKLNIQPSNLDAQPEPDSSNDIEDKIPTLIGNKLSNNDDDTDDDE